MAKKLNFSNMNYETIDTLSKYDIAVKALKILRAEHREKMEKLNDELAKVQSDRKEALDKGMSLDEVTAKYDISATLKKIDAENDKYKNDCKPHNKAKKDAIKGFIPDELYNAYCVTVLNGEDTDYVGTFTSGKKTIEVTKSLNDCMKDFAISLDAKNTEYKGAIDKFVKSMTFRVSGVKASRELDEYVTAFTKSVFNEKVILGLLQYLVIDKKVLEPVSENNDGLKMVEYNN